MKFQFAEYVDPIGVGGALAIWWSEECLKVLRKSKNFIDFRRKTKENEDDWAMTFIHAECDFFKRQEN